MSNNINIERHPWKPFIPELTKILFLGTFPPGQHRWAMDFYYPNPTNDFWRIMGLVFFNNKNQFYDTTFKRFDDCAIKNFLTKNLIAIGDTAIEVKRLKNNASDKYLEIITTINLIDITRNAPSCNTIVSTGEKAAQVIASLTSTTIPDIGNFTTFNFQDQRTIKISRMPSTARTNTLALEKKAGFYYKMFCEIGII